MTHQSSRVQNFSWHLYEWFGLTGVNTQLNKNCIIMSQNILQCCVLLFIKYQESVKQYVFSHGIMCTVIKYDNLMKSVK